MWKHYALLWIVLFVLFGLVQDAGYVTDYIGWQTRVDEGGLLGVFHTYDYPAQLQGYAFLMWLFEQLRSVSTWLVHAFTISLYAGAALLLKNLVQAVVKDHGMEGDSWIGWIAAGLFAFSPTNTEIVIWRVCPHYLVSILVWLSSLLLLRRFFQNGERKHLGWALAAQLLGLFSLELAYALPIAIIGWASYYVLFLGIGNWKRVLIAVGTALGLVAFHLVLTRIVQGAWIGHYGAEVATSQTLSEIIAAPWRWMARAAFHYRFWPNEWKNYLTSVLGNPMVSLTLYGIVALILGWALQVRIRSRKLKPSPPLWNALLLWIFLAGAGTAAVSQLYFYDFFPIENDRLGTLTVVFVAASIATLLATLPKKHGIIAGCLIVGISFFVQFRAINAWSESQRILTGLSSSFSEIVNNAGENKVSPETVYLIGYSRSFLGVQLLADHRKGFSALAGYLSSAVSAPYQGSQDNLNLIDISQFHQLALTDTYNAEWGNNRLYVSLDAPGSWMMYNDNGIVNRRNEKYGFDVVVEEYNIQVLWDTPPPPNTIFLYQQNDRFLRLPYPVAGKSPQPATTD